jgi:hypothetical protein
MKKSLLGNQRRGREEEASFKTITEAAENRFLVIRADMIILFFKVKEREHFLCFLFCIILLYRLQSIWLRKVKINRLVVLHAFNI